MKVHTYKRMTAKSEATEKVHDILKSFSTAMLVTIGPTSRPVARPMHIARIEEDGGRVWFLTGNTGHLVKEISEEAVVLLVFQNENSAYLSLRGKARLVEDRSRIKDLWKEPYKVWFPKGADDPEIALIAVDPIDAEYWDNRGTNKLEYLFEAAKAYLKGEKPELAGVDQHAKTSL
jgi:general stress protein 26